MIKNTDDTYIELASVCHTSESNILKVSIMRNPANAYFYVDSIPAIPKPKKPRATTKIVMTIEGEKFTQLQWDIIQDRLGLADCVAECYCDEHGKEGDTGIYAQLFGIASGVHDSGYRDVNPFDRDIADWCLVHAVERGYDYGAMLDPDELRCYTRRLTAVRKKVERITGLVIENDYMLSEGGQ